MLRPDQTIELLSDGLNFDWPKGYDGDIVLATRVAQTLTTQVAPSGDAQANLDAPNSSEPFQVRVFVTDPATGVVHTASQIGKTF